MQKIWPKLTKTSKQHGRHCCGIPVVKQTLIWRVDVPLTFKNVRRRKKVYNKCKSEKNTQGRFSITQQIWKWSFLLKLLTTVNCKLFSQKSTILDVTQILSSPLTKTNPCFLRIAKDPYHRFLERWLLLPSRDFT